MVFRAAALVAQVLLALQVPRDQQVLLVSLVVDWVDLVQLGPLVQQDLQAIAGFRAHKVELVFLEQLAKLGQKVKRGHLEHVVEPKD
jgi:hypothetical protein